MKKREDAYDSILRAWGDSQQQLLEAWSELVNTGASSMADLLERQFGPQRPPGQPDESPLANKMANVQLAGPAAIKELIDLSLGAWKMAVSAETTSEQWTTLAQEFAQQWIDHNLKHLAAMTAEEGARPHLWKVFLDQLPGLSPTSLGLLPPARAEAIDEQAGHHLWLTLHDGLDPLPWLASELARLPHVGAVDTTLTRRLLLGFDAWYLFITAEQKHQLIRLKAWGEISERAVHRLADLAQAGKSIKTAREWLLLWIDAGDDVLIDMYRSEAYLKIQRELMTATMNYKKWLQDFGGSILEAYGVPTRAELDDAYRSIHDLRREVRALKKELRARGVVGEPQREPTAAGEGSAGRAAKRTSNKARPSDT